MMTLLWAQAIFISFVTFSRAQHERLSSVLEGMAIVNTFTTMTASSNYNCRLKCFVTPECWSASSQRLNFSSLFSCKFSNLSYPEMIPAFDTLVIYSGMPEREPSSSTTETAPPTTTVPTTTLLVNFTTPLQSTTTGAEGISEFWGMPSPTTTTATPAQITYFLTGAIYASSKKNFDLECQPGVPASIATNDILQIVLYEYRSVWFWLSAFQVESDYAFPNGVKLSSIYNASIWDSFGGQGGCISAFNHTLVRYECTRGYKLLCQL